MLKKLCFLGVCFTFLVTCPVMADNTVDITEGMTDAQVIATLQNDIVELDKQILKCEKQRKNWLAATIIGGVGVAATGTAAIVQGSKLSQDKQELNRVNSQINK